MLQSPTEPFTKYDHYNSPYIEGFDATVMTRGREGWKEREGGRETNRNGGGREKERERERL